MHCLFTVALQNRLSELLRVDSRSEALMGLNKALEHDGSGLQHEDMFYALNNRCNLLVVQGRSKDALIDAERLVEMFPNRPLHTPWEGTTAHAHVAEPHSEVSHVWDPDPPTHRSQEIPRVCAFACKLDVLNRKQIAASWMC